MRGFQSLQKQTAETGPEPCKNGEANDSTNGDEVYASSKGNLKVPDKLK